MFRNRRRSKEDFAEEIRTHLALEADELASSGLSSREASRRARATFGSIPAAREQFHLRSRIAWIEHLSQDLRYALRALIQSPAFTSTAILTLALGMGANIAIFSLIDAVLLRSLPVQQPDQLYFLKYAGAKGIGLAPPYPCFERLHAQSKSFTSMAAFAGGPYELKVRIGGSLERAFGTRVSGDYFTTLDLQPVAGRLLTPADQQLAPATAVISYDYWQRRFGLNPAAIGSNFTLDNTRFTIVGVAPRSFHGLFPGHQADFTLPMTTMLLGPHDGAGMLADTGSPWFDIVARLKPGTSPQQARAEADTIFQSYMQQYPMPPDLRRDVFNHMVLVPASRGIDDLRKQYSRPLLALMFVVALVLLIACANITNLLLARAVRRQREFAVRVALGAGRSRLVRQLLAENTLLFTLGALAGACLAAFAIHAIDHFFSSGSQPITLDVHMDWRLAAFTAAIALLATLLFGAAPILRALRTDPNSALKSGAQTTTSNHKFSGIDLGRALIVLQIALSLILLVGASLFLRTLNNLYAIDAGFQPEHVLLSTIQLLESSYPGETQRISAWSRILDRIRSIPGVESAGVSEMTPLDGSGRHVGFQPNGGAAGGLNMNTVSEDYFATTGTRLIRGHSFTQSDNLASPHVAILNQSAVKEFFPDRDPLGVTVHVNDDATYQIVGVVQDVKERGLRQDAGSFIYLPFRQPYDRNFRMTLSVRTALNPEALAPTIQKLIQSSGPDILITRTETLTEQLDSSVAQQRLISALASIFGLLALVLSAIGLYGVLACSVLARTREIGIRLALGELPSRILRGFLTETSRLIILGSAIGIPASLLLARAANSLLYGVTSNNFATQILCLAILAAVALGASLLPAHRASRINPMEALRME
ncbi:ADOP family duplicated permease [Acidicapsa dinghuensis]|uniref:ADOP family duplicated permease n=1 Tax=Acidicapsa dinghuensis TaxID=2218256 RepID=A0ABW1EM18_9BACT|nr:ABC transporter permease [Acidicapsa dinghuensis]